jgi:hypothetical protein
MQVVSDLICKRYCPKCKKEIIHKGKYSKNNCRWAEKINGICHSCATKKSKNSFQINSVPWNKGLRGFMAGEKNGNFGKPGSRLGKITSNETKEKQRIAKINLLKKNKINIKSNPVACKFIDKLNEENGWNLQHALNGGEIEICGYFVDGYDKERNIIFEYDEKEHRWGKRKEKDLIRQQEIINKICPQKFIRYSEYEEKLYNII